MSIAESNRAIAALATKIDELLELLRHFSDLIEKANNNNNQEAIAAKIINDISRKLDENDCCKEIIQEIRKTKPNNPDNKPLVIHEPKESSSKGPKYTFPNHLVGNTNLGYSGDPDALEWPFSK